MTDDARAAWSVAIRDREGIDAPAARFNAELLTALAGRRTDALKPIGRCSASDSCARTTAIPSRNGPRWSMRRPIAYESP